MKATPGLSSGNKTIMDIYHMTSITPQNIAYAAVLVSAHLASQRLD